MKAIPILTLAVLTLNASGRESGESNVKTLEDFNRKFRESILNTDHAAMLAMWCDDGVDLMPGEAPLMGKKQLRHGSKASKRTGLDLGFRWKNWNFMTSKSQATGHQNGPTNIRLSSRLENLRLRRMERSHWCCILRRPGNGASNRKCGMSLRSADLSVRLVVAELSVPVGSSSGLQLNDSLLLSE
jgi:hypothetical protein